VSAALLLTLLAGAAAAEPESVLLIYADPRLVPAIVTVDQTLRATIDAGSPSPVRFYSEYLDVAWFSQGQESLVGRAIRQKYAGRKFDLVIPCGESALRFALEQREELFPGVPIVFCTVEDEAIADLRLPADVTGTTFLRDWAAAVDLILALHPGTRRIVFIGGAGPVEQSWEKLARATFSRYGDRLGFTYLSGLPMAEIVAAVGALDKGTVILFNVFLRDGAGRTFSSPEALAAVRRAAKVPIYGLAETQIGHGIVGGRLVSYEAQAREAGKLALRILGGERLGPGTIVRRVPSEYVFDARQLERWRIPEGRLPPGSVVMFRTPSVWSEYKWHILAGLAFAFAETVLIAGLLIHWRQRRRIQRRLDERLQFEMLLADLAAAFVEVPAREIDDRIGSGLRRIVRDLAIDRATLSEFIAGGQLRVTHARTRDGVSAPPAGFTREAWPWSLGRLQRGYAVCFSRLEELPEEATKDRESFAALPIRSTAIVPVVVGGAVIGALGCGMQEDGRDWPDELVGRLRVLADTFAVVLMRRRAEEEVQREREGLTHALRVATLGELAGSLAHEISQPLAAIASNAQAASRMLGKDRGDSEVPEVLRDIAADAHRAAQVIQQLRTLFRKAPGERHPVDMRAMLEEVVRLVRKDLERRNVRLELALPSDAPRVLGDVVQLQQVILNLILNACEAMGADADRRELGIELAAREEGILTVTVRDSGKAVEEGELERIFERFVTTKPEGLGMGLSISRSIVETHGGRIWATRNPDRGLTMHVELPCQESYVRPVAEATVQ
jgi:C4-dicarboxylate-specific signal transduction histidine kinase/ABC-type uncharacterized transport system substrate-binding protein